MTQSLILVFFPFYYDSASAVTVINHLHFITIVTGTLNNELYEIVIIFIPLWNIDLLEVTQAVEWIYRSSHAMHHYCKNFYLKINKINYNSDKLGRVKCGLILLLGLILTFITYMVSLPVTVYTTRWILCNTIN